MGAQPVVTVAVPAGPRAVKRGPVSVPPRPPVSVVVPCYEEAAGIPSLLGRLEGLVALGWEFVFVDDGSQDATFETLLAAAGSRSWMRVVRHGRNRGLGAAMRTGFAHARAPVVCTIDSDCTYGPERLPELVRLIEQGADIATASPWHPDCVRPAGRSLRFAASRAVSQLYRALLGGEVHTFTSLYRAYRRDVLEHTRFRAAGFTAVAELLVRGMLSGCRVGELPMPVGARRHGRSKLRMVRAVAAHLGLLAVTAGLASARWARVRIGAHAT
jgi:dolichol-phosphate mannosyltransferase